MHKIRLIVLGISAAVITTVAAIAATAPSIGSVLAHLAPSWIMPAGKIYINTKTMMHARYGKSGPIVVADNANPPNAQNSAGAGAFRILCDVSHMSFDDPIVWPGRPGKTHLHVFFANQKTGAASVLTQMPFSGNSSCNGGTINRSGYWTPALIYHRPGNVRDGEVQIPTINNAYYKGHCCTGDSGNSAIVWPGAGLRMISGYANNTDPNALPGRFDCLESDQSTTNGFNHIPTTADVTALGAGNCVEMIILVQFHSCWNGNIDSPDHVSHVTDIVDPYTNPLCSNSSYPILLPSISYNIHYQIAAADYDYMRLASDQPKATATGTCADAAHNYCAGASLHGDWVNGWNQTDLFFGKTIPDWILENCLNKSSGVNSAGGKSSDCHDDDLGTINSALPTQNYRLE